MQSNDRQEILSVLTSVITRKKWLIACAVIAVLIPIFYYNETTQPTYESSAMVVFEEIQVDIASIDYNMSHQIFFSNQLVEIKSYSFAKDIYKALPERALSKFKQPDSTFSDFDQTEYIVSVIQQGIAAFPVKASNIISISFRSSSPVLCQEVVNTAAKILEIRNTENKKAGVGGVRKFINEQLDQYKAKLDSSETRLKAFKERYNITSVDRETEGITRNLTELEVRYNSLLTQIASLRQRLISLDEKMQEQQKDLVPGSTEIGTTWAQALRDRLIKLNADQQRLKAQGYSDDHPKMRELADEIEKVKSELTTQMKGLTEGNNAVDPVAQIEKYASEKIDIQLQVDALEAERIDMERTMGQYNRELSTMPDKEFMLARLIREREVNLKIYQRLLERHEEAKISEAEQTKSVRIIDRAGLPLDPISPNKKVNLVIGGMMGLIIGLLIAFVMEFRNNTIRSHSEVERITGWPIIAMIPWMDKFSKGKFKKTKYTDNSKESDKERSYRALISSLEPHTVIAEAYRMMRTNLQFSGIGREYKTLLVTSLAPGDGKTTTIANLAVTFANFGTRTLMIDSDLRIPRGHTIFGVEKEMGVTDLLVALNELDNSLAQPKSAGQENGAVVPVTAQTSETEAKRQQAGGKKAKNGQPDAEPESDGGNAGAGHQRDRLLPLRTLFQRVIKPTNIANLHFLSSGTRLNDPSKFLSIKSMPLILQKFGNIYNTILIDSGPLLLVDETLMLAGLVDAVVVVVNPEKCEPGMLVKAKKLLDSAKANVVGVVLNNSEEKQGYEQYYSYYDAETES